MPVPWLSQPVLGRLSLSLLMAYRIYPTNFAKNFLRHLCGTYLHNTIEAPAWILYDKLNFQGTTPSSILSIYCTDVKLCCRCNISSTFRTFHAPRDGERMPYARSVGSPFAMSRSLAIIQVCFGSIAQSVEQRTLNPRVAGSIPARPTIYKRRKPLTCIASGFLL